MCLPFYFHHVSLCSLGVNAVTCFSLILHALQHVPNPCGVKESSLLAAASVCRYVTMCFPYYFHHISLCRLGLGEVACPPLVLHALKHVPNQRGVEESSLLVVASLCSYVMMCLFLCSHHISFCCFDPSAVPLVFPRPHTCG